MPRAPGMCFARLSLNVLTGSIRPARNKKSLTDRERIMRNTFRGALVAAALLAHVASAQALNIQFDYSLDTQNFFTADKRQTLDQVASIFGRNLTNSLGGISNLSFTQSMVWTDSYTGQRSSIPGSSISASNVSVAADTLLIYVGAADLPDSTLGLAWVGTATPSRAAATRGGFMSGFGGQIMFDTVGTYVDYARSNPYTGNYVYTDGPRRWYADSDVRNFEHVVQDQHIPITGVDVPPGAYWTVGVDEERIDFYSVAMHEMGHVLGLNHFESMSTAYGVSQTTAMGPSIAADAREYFTEADWAALRTKGWQVASLSPELVVTAVPEPASLTMLLAGLGILGLARRRVVGQA